MINYIGQSKYIDGLLGSKKNGFYVEAGGFNGELYSNSLFFELERDWDGILIEANPKMFKEIVAKKRRTYALNACLADKVKVAKFRNFPGVPALSGLEDEMSAVHKNRGKNEGGDQVEYFQVPCFSLVTILKALDVRMVDYFSLDVEGLPFSSERTLTTFNGMFFLLCTLHRA